MIPRRGLIPPAFFYWSMILCCLIAITTVNAQVDSVKTKSKGEKEIPLSYVPEKYPEAQEVSDEEGHKPFRVVAATGIAAGASNLALLLMIEPEFRLSDNVSIGLRAEEARIYGTGHWAFRSFAASVKMYFSPKAFRPFLGLGVGSCFGGMTYRNGAYEMGAISSLMFYPRLGFDYGHLSVFIDYNIITATTQTSTYIYTLVENKPMSTYLGIHVGVAIGGGGVK